MRKEFVPYKIALDMKELGFDELCIATYDENEYFEFLDFEQSYYTIPSKLIQAPLFQQAFRWFREKYKKVDYPEFDYDEQKWYCHSNYQSHILFDTYEEAELECLVKLIEIVKNGK